MQWPDEEGVERVGTATVQMPDQTGGLKRPVLSTLTFGSTEISFRVTDVTSKGSATTTLSFLDGVAVARAAAAPAGPPGGVTIK